MRKGKLKLPKGMQHALFVFDGKVREVCQAYLPRNEVMCRWDTMIGGEQTIVEAAIPFADYPNCLPVLRKEAIKKFKNAEARHG